jgi:hypothetical protein
MEDSARFGRVVAEGDRIAVVDVPNGHADDVGSKVASGIARGRDGISRETEIEEANVVPGRIQG